ncbi:hypothetical protein, partial [Chitinophaga sp.]|uniref:hypothetical protein n=1 Tax=Chitinophaga sp. TaxID=1869181 RepID=UPI002F95917E
PGVLIARVKARIEIPWDGSSDKYLKELAKLRSARNLAPVDHALRMVNFLSRGDRSESFEKSRYNEDFFGISATLPLEFNAFQSFLKNKTEDVVSLLIGAPDPEVLKKNLVKKVVNRNEKLNEKSKAEHLMINRQGIVYILPEGNYRGPHTARFDRTMDLAVLGHFCSIFLENRDMFRTYPTYTKFIGEKVDSWIHKSELSFKSSVSNRLAWDVLSRSLKLKEHALDWHSNFTTTLEKEANSFFQNVQEDWWRDPNFPRLLDNQHDTDNDPTRTLSDPSLQDFVRRDRMEALRCRTTGNYRASVVMAGAAIEGTLLSNALKLGKTSKEKLVKMSFQDLIKESCSGYKDDPTNRRNAQRSIKPETANLLDNVLRPWRNYVHAGLAFRADQEVTKPAADAAIAALDLLLGEIK